MEHRVVQPHTLAPNLAGCGASAGIPPAMPWMLKVAVNDAPIGAIALDLTGAASVDRTCERGISPEGDGITR